MRVGQGARGGLLAQVPADDQVSSPYLFVEALVGILLGLVCRVVRRGSSLLFEGCAMAWSGTGGSWYSTVADIRYPLGHVVTWDGYRWSVLAKYCLGSSAHMVVDHFQQKKI